MGQEDSRGKFLSRVILALLVYNSFVKAKTKDKYVRDVLFILVQEDICATQKMSNVKFAANIFFMR